MARRPRKPVQLDLPVRTWGGRRANAGRKHAAGREGFVPHAPRPAHASAHPSHVTLRVQATLPTLRSQVLFRLLRQQLTVASRGAFRVTVFSVQHDHIHLVVEASDRVRLARGIQRFSARLARLFNTTLGRRGKVFRDRYHRHDLKTPREVRNAYVYVLMNRRKHAKPDEKTRALAGLDPCSSIRWFAGLHSRDGPERLARALEALTRADEPLTSKVPPVVRPDTWLGRVGWRRHGSIELGERPASQAHR